MTVDRAQYNSQCKSYKSCTEYPSIVVKINKTFYLLQHIYTYRKYQYAAVNTKN